jgi:hypothetical protein
MTWDAASRTPLPPISQRWTPGCSRFAHETSRHRQDRVGQLPVGKQPRPRRRLISGRVSTQRNGAQMTHNPEVDLLSDRRKRDSASAGLEGNGWRSPVGWKRTPGLDGRDEELAVTIAELLALPTVAEIDDPAQTVNAIRNLGVVGRAEFTSENRSVLSHLREDGDLLHLYLYHFLYETGEPVNVEVALPGAGAVHRIDAWTGAVHPHSGVRRDGDRTIVSVTLNPGETALLTLDRSAAAAVESTPASPETLAEITDWRIVVESWDAGELQLITEDRGLGYQTHEVRPATAITRLDAGTGPLRAWKDIHEVGPEVSGIGEYTTSLHLDQEPQQGYRYLLDLGSAAGGLGSVRANDGDVKGFDTSTPVVDLTDDLRAGDNTVTVRVASSLNNRLLARGYYERVPDIITQIVTNEPRMQTTHVRDRGLLGPVQLRRKAVRQ